MENSNQSADVFLGLHDFLERMRQPSIKSGTDAKGDNTTLSTEQLQTHFPNLFYYLSDSNSDSFSNSNSNLDSDFGFEFNFSETGDDDSMGSDRGEGVLEETSSRGEGGSATKQMHDTRLLCRLKDIVCLLLSYSISFKSMGRVTHWIQEVLKSIKHCRLKFISRLASDGFLSFDSAKFTLPPNALGGIEFYLPYWFPPQSEESEGTVSHDSPGATTELVDLAVDSVIVQLNKCFSEEMQANIHLITITGEGAKKVTSSLKDLVFIKDMFDLVHSATISENENIHDLEKVIDRQWVDFPKAKIILLLDDVHDMTTLYKWTYRKFQYGDYGNKLKVVVTQLHNVNQPFLVDLEIRMEDHLVPWSVFSRNVGQILHTSTIIQSISASIIKKCKGYLPAIIVLARALRGIADPDVWEDALYHMHSPVADCTTTSTTNTTTTTGTTTTTITIITTTTTTPPTNEAIMINALKFSLSRKNRVTRQYLKSYIHNVSRSMVSPPGDCTENDLVDAFLLHKSEDGEGLTMEEEVRQILLRTSILDVCEMIEDGESNALEIQLVNIDISQLPLSPSCPMITGLFLQMNNGLTLLPSSFFKYMACLQILNLSNTSISSLPASFFQLFGLEKLYLKDCDLFMELPSTIKELKNLKELDLEGTALLSLPKEVGDLKRLTCLRVSFHGECPSETMIPTGTLSKLSMLMNLCIDVNPGDRRWDEAVKVVIREVSYLKQLKSLEMYLPEVTLLDELRMSLPSFIHDSATKFKLTVGRHQRRIMSRVPLGVEGQFSNSNKCLKYVNGNELNSNISTQVKDVLKHCDCFFLNRHFTITELAKLGIENMKNLKFCALGENDELLTAMSPYALLPLLETLIIYRMKNMRSIVEGPLEKGSLRLLKSLILNGCPRLEVVFTPESLASLRSLEELIVEDCPAISSLLSGVSKLGEAKDTYSKYRTRLRRLKNLSLHHLPELTSIFGIEPNVVRMSVYDCPKLRDLLDISSRLKVIRGENHWFNALQWEDPFSKGIASRAFVPIRRGSHFKTQLAADGFNF